MLKIGILGGTFDPIHIGHLFLAERVRSDLNLNKVIFVPSRLPPHKIGQKVLPAEHRLNMVKSAVCDNPDFEVSDIEMKRQGPSFTYTTMEYFAEEYPQAELYFLMGSDSLLELNTWKNLDRLAQLCRFVVVTRPGYDLTREDPQVQDLPDLVWRETSFLEVPGFDISSTEVRQRIRESKSVRYMVLPQTLEYIRQHRLYEDNHED